MPESVVTENPVAAEELITTPEAGAVLCVSQSTVTMWATEGRLPVALRLPGQRGARLFRRSDVVRLAGVLLVEAEARAADLRGALAAAEAKTVAS